MICRVELARASGVDEDLGRWVFPDVPRVGEEIRLDTPAPAGWVEGDPRVKDGKILCEVEHVIWDGVEQEEYVRAFVKREAELQAPTLVVR